MIGVIGFDLLWLLLPVAAVSGWYAARRGKRAEDDVGPESELRSDYFTGISHLLNEQPDKAIEAFIKVLEVDSETVETHLALGNLYRRRGEVDRAIRIHQNITTRSRLSREQRSEAHLELGQDYLSAGLLDRAEDLFEQLVDQKIYSVQALRQLIDIYEQEKDWDKAIRCAQSLEKATGNQLGGVIAHYSCEQAERFRDAGEIEAGLRSVHDALRSHAGCVRASLIEGELLIQAGRHAEALDAYRRIEQQDPDFVSEMIPSMHQCFKTLARSQDMEEYFTHVMESYDSITATIALAEIKREAQGNMAAVQFIASRLRQRVSVRALDRMLQLELEAGEGGSDDHLHILKDLTEALLQDRPVYKCEHCGFPARSLHWKCPSCKHWNSIKPIQGVEGV